MNIAVLWHRIGPYHIARLNALGRVANTVAIEMSGEDNTYAWSKTPNSDGFDRVTVYPTCDCDTRPPGEVSSRLFEVLNKIKPDVIAIPSWGECYALSALRWSLEHKISNIVMTESQYGDFPRHWWKEFVKRRIVSNFDAALCGGNRQKHYLEFLGMASSRIFSGYDCVDNYYFSTSADAARIESARLRGHLGLPSKYFLASSRFVQKKNLSRLIAAYSRYYERNRTASWKLVILGDGPLRQELECLTNKFGLVDQIKMPGFKQYTDLPAYYALAKAFVLPSTEEQWGLVVNEAMACGLPVIVSRKCGCVEDLVQNSINGYTFDPLDVDGLADLMTKFSDGSVDITAFGNASRRIIKTWNPDVFAENMMNAVECALAQPKRRIVLDKFVLKAVSSTR